jgi:hypothetical protein
MKGCFLFLLSIYLTAPTLGHGQTLPPYKVVPDFFTYPPQWIPGEASGVALNSKGHIFLFQRAKPMLSEFDESGHYLRGVVELDQRGKVLGALGSPGHDPGQFAWGHFLAIGADRKLFVADVLNWRFQAFTPTPSSGKLSDYVPTERKFFGFKPSDGYIYHSPGWPVK